MQEYDFQKIQRLLRDFYNLTQIKICLYDSSENELCFFPGKYTPFCQLLRSDKEQDALCRECDKRAFAECRRTHRPYTYTCHAGLLECFSPILHGDTIIGYIVIGQIRSNEGVVSFSDELQALYEQLPAIPLEKIKSAIHILEACTGYEYLKKLDLQSQRLTDRLRSYITEHLEGALSVENLCDEFHLTRVELYEIFKVSFDCTVAEFIKKCRLEKACELLRETSLPVHKIAVLCGIPDYNYFSKIFHKVYSTNPRAYRKNIKN